MKYHDNKRTPIGKLGKYGLIELLTTNIKPKNNSSIKGIGDDAAIIDKGKHQTVISTDLLLEGIHFSLTYTPLKHLGYKAVIRGLSDIYAMNANPEQLLIALGLSSRFSVEQVEELYDGVKQACNNYNIDLVGGDITSSMTGLTISVTAIGKGNKDSITTRSGARENDLICVTGDFGASYIGLQILEREKKLFIEEKVEQPDLSGFEYMIGKQLKPEIPVKVLDELRNEKIVPTAMTDVTEGLASDLINICKSSGTGCKIYSEKIPVDYETAKVAEEFNINSVTAALNGGEDYELLFTIPLSLFDKISTISSVRVIGHMTNAQEGNILIVENGPEVTLTGRGWGET